MANSRREKDSGQSSGNQIPSEIRTVDRGSRASDKQVERYQNDSLMKMLEHATKQSETKDKK